MQLCSYEIKKKYGTLRRQGSEYFNERYCSMYCFPLHNYRYLHRYTYNCIAERLVILFQAYEINVEMRSHSTEQELQ